MSVVERAPASQLRVAGRSTVRLDAADKVTGKFVYGADLDGPGMLHCRVFRARVPHALVKRLDTSRARQMPGVRAILTAADVPAHIRYGHTLKDEVVFARDRVRYYGEPLAAVAADTPEMAAAALDLITVEYDELPVMDDPEAALAPDAPLLHPDWRTYKANPGLIREGNMCGRTRINVGDVDSAFAAADHVFSDVYETHMVHQGYLEARAGMARPEAGGSITVISSTQNPFGLLGNLSDILELPSGKIRVIATGVGGGFGGKLDLGVEHFVALLARKTGRPVKYLWTREEEMLAAAPRMRAKIYLKTGVMRDGTLVARDIRLIFDAGAYGGDSTTIVSVAAMLGRGAYRTPHYRCEALAVYTNKANCGAYRGPSGPQTYFAVESHMDRIARELGMDRLELRRCNLLREGDQGPTRQVLTGVGLAECVDRAAAAIGWGSPLPQQPGKRYGRGLAAGWWTTTTGSSCAYVKVNDDATIDLITGGKEIGTGALTAGVAQLVAEEMGLDVADVRIIQGDTAATPYDFGAQGSRTTYNVGSAGIRAARDARDQMLAAAAEEMGVATDQLELRDRRIFVRDDPARSMGVDELVQARLWKGGPFLGRGSFIATQPEYDPTVIEGGLYPVFNSPSFHCHAAEVEVDEATGEVTLRRFIVAQDVGFAVNPLYVAGQMTGGATQGIGYALSEEIVYRDGVVLNPNMTDYKMPTAVDVPAIETIIVEQPSTSGPYGAKGVGEPPIILPAAAIANAVSDAIGVPVHRLPITAERVLKALRGKEETP